MFLLGVLNVPATSSVNNTTTSSPFKIPATIRKLWFSTDTAAHVKFGTDPALVAAASDIPLPTGTSPIGPYDTDGIAATMQTVNGNCVPAGATSAKQGGASQTAPDVPTVVLAAYNATGGAAVISVYGGP